MSEQQSPPGNESGPLTAAQVRANLAAVRAELLASLELGQEKRLSPAEITQLRGMVSEAIQGYQDLLAAASAGERTELEHTLGRAVIDLRRTAGRFPQFSSGTATTISVDRIPGGGQPFIETRAPGRSILGSGGGGPKRGEAPKVTPGSEVEAWCGPCGGLRSHNVFAVVDNQPKQVICQSCGARHGFRLTPARAKPKDDEAPKPVDVPYKPRKTPEQLADERRQKESDKLREQLAVVETVVPYDPKRRYKAGQVVEHPEHGRGKIENVLRASMLVRFPVGLRTVALK